MGDVWQATPKVAPISHSSRDSHSCVTPHLWNLDWTCDSLLTKRIQQKQWGVLNYVYMIMLHKTNVCPSAVSLFLSSFDEAGFHAGGPMQQGFTVEFLQVFLADSNKMKLSFLLEGREFHHNPSELGSRSLWNQTFRWDPHFSQHLDGSLAKDLVKPHLEVLDFQKPWDQIWMLF